MPTLTWWLLHAIQGAAVLAALGLALAAARRVGGHTLYGNLLFMLALSFAWLLMAEAAFVGRQAMGAWGGLGSFIDVLALLGWAAFITSVFVFVDRFSDPVAPPWRRRMRLVWAMAVPVSLLLVLFRTWLSPPGADPDAWVRFPYLVADGMVIGLVAGGIDRFVRLRHSALGRLYAFLGAAIVSKTASDVYWAYLGAHGGTSWVATALSSLGGLLAVVGLALHLRSMRREEVPEAAHLPWLRPEQLELAALATRLHGLAGGYAAKTVLMASGAAFDARGIPWRVDGRTLAAEAGPEAWRAALAAGEKAATEVFGAAGRGASLLAGGARGATGEARPETGQAGRAAGTVYGVAGGTEGDA